MSDELPEYGSGKWKRESLAALLAAQPRQRSMDDPDNVRIAIHWLREKWKHPNCPYCEAADSQVGTPLEVRLSGDEVMSPAFPVMCGNCGHTTFVNAVLAG